MGKASKDNKTRGASAVALDGLLACCERGIGQRTTRSEDIFISESGLSTLKACKKVVGSDRKLF